MSPGREVGCILLLALLPATLSFGWNLANGSLKPRPPKVEPVSVETVRGWPTPLWIDARSEAEYGDGHIPGALALNESRWNDGILPVLDAWRPGRKVVVYCGDLSCEKSESVALRLKANTGWNDIYVLKGGWEAWSAGPSR